MDNRMEHLGIVVIGRNEALRLGACLDALIVLGDRLVYVDSGSTDASVAVAEGRGVRVIRLTNGPYTAARGRQTGLENLRRHPQVRYIQFVDGDCILQPGWLERAVAFLEENPRVAVVVGRLRERRAGQSVWLRLADMDWDLPTGNTDAIGGIAMARIEALHQVGGWRTDMIAGEELDLGARLRAAGWQLHRLADEMTLHDMGITTGREFWRRAVRSGFSYANLAVLHGRSRCRRWLRRTIGHVVYGAVLPLLLVACLVVRPAVAAVIVAGYGLLMLRMAYGQVRRGQSLGFAGLHAVVLTGCKVAGAIGAGRFFCHWLMGRPSRLIEYKSNAVGRGYNGRLDGRLAR
jgi:GT2 family glycosyltransferase